MSAADGNAQFRIPSLIDPTDGSGVATALEWFKRLQPMHGLPSWQSRYRGSWVECGCEGKRLVA
jgi:hypothetical protein